MKTISDILKEKINYTEATFGNMSRTIKEKYSFGIIAMARAFAKGDDVGVLTARGNQAGHVSMHKTIEGVVGKKLKKSHIYHVNDDIMSERLLDVFGSRSDLKKLHVLVEYRNGQELTKQYILKKKHKQFERVKFYDDEEKNLIILSDPIIAEYKEILMKIAQDDTDKEVIENLKFDGITVYNIHDFDVAKLDRIPAITSYIRKLIRGFGQAKTIHFFDLDGTVYTHSVKMFVRKGDDTLFPITQEEFAENKPLSSAEKILGADDMIQREKYSDSEVKEIITKATTFEDPYYMDFSSFREEEFIEPQAKDKNLRQKEEEMPDIVEDEDEV